MEFCDLVLLSCRVAKDQVLGIGKLEGTVVTRYV